MEKVWVVPFAYKGRLEGVKVFSEESKAQKFMEELRKDYDDPSKLDLFYQHLDVE